MSLFRRVNLGPTHSIVETADRSPTIIMEEVSSDVSDRNEDYLKWFNGFGERETDHPDLTDYDRGIYPAQLTPTTSLYKPKRGS